MREKRERNTSADLLGIQRDALLGRGDGRFRYRPGGDKYLPGNRVGDAIGGPEVVFGYEHLFLAVSGGPSTVGVTSGLGWTATSTIGGALFF